MNFRPELAQAVLEGRKTVTRRVPSDNPRSPWFIGACALVPGRSYAVCPGRGKNAIGRVRVTSVRLVPLGYLSDYEARCEGFEGGAEFDRAWEEINGDFDPGQLVWRVEFELETKESEPGES